MMSSSPAASGAAARAPDFFLVKDRLTRVDEFACPYVCTTAVLVLYQYSTSGTVPVRTCYSTTGTGTYLYLTHSFAAPSSISSPITNHHITAIKKKITKRTNERTGRYEYHPTY